MSASPAPKDIIESVAWGLIDKSLKLENCVAVAVKLKRRNSQGWPVHMFAARIVGHDVNVVGVWAIGDLDLLSVGPIFAVDGPAREFSTWGAAGKGDSQAEAIKDRFVKYPEVAEARRAVEPAI